MKIGKGGGGGGGGGGRSQSGAQAVAGRPFEGHVTSRYTQRFNTKSSSAPVAGLLAAVAYSHGIAWVW